MRMRIVLSTLLLLPAWGWQADKNQALEARLSSPAGSYPLEAGGFVPALLKVAADFQLPMGIQYVRNPAEPLALRRSWSGASVLNILQDIAGTREGYTVEVSNGVVHVAPSAWRGDPSDILNARVGTFEVKNNYVRYAAWRLAYAARAIMDPPPEAGSYGGSFATSTSGDRRISLTLQNPTVREVLDELCLAADLKIWLVTYAPSPTRTSAGFRRTTALIGGVREFPDEQYPPVWTFWEWGQMLQVLPNGSLDLVR